MTPEEIEKAKQKISEPVASPYQHEIPKIPKVGPLDDIIKNLPKGTQVVQSKLDPKEIASSLLLNFRSTHEQGECPSCEEMYVKSFASCLTILSVPPFIVQMVLNEWMRMIKEDPPDFIEPRNIG